MRIEPGAVKPRTQQRMAFQREAQSPGQSGGVPGIVRGERLLGCGGGETAQSGGRGEQAGGEPGQKGGGSTAQAKEGKEPDQVARLKTQAEVEKAKPDCKLQKSQAQGGEAQNSSPCEQGG